MNTQTTMTVDQIRKLIIQLEGENDPTNDELIVYYRRAILLAVNKAYDKYFSKCK